MAGRNTEPLINQLLHQVLKKGISKQFK